MIARAAEALPAEQAVGWFQGRMEFGPRALGNRSILGDPRAFHAEDPEPEDPSCPVLVDTSFNIRGEPIVCTPEYAYRCFTMTGVTCRWPAGVPGPRTGSSRATTRKSLRCI